MPKPKPDGRNDGHVADYTKITENIYIGSNLCKGSVCSMHGPEFKKLGVCVEINLDNERKEIPPDNLECYFWMPVVDGYPPSPAQIKMGTSVINEAVTSGMTVYVHCKNGHGRSPTLVAAYLIRHKGMKVYEAIDFIKSKRPEIHIEERQVQTLHDFANL
jgi:protein-tyrosine phosphatase